jgi:cob(I)alamin adenosyltransferase
VKAKIYTKTGDKGQTSLVDGTRVPKTHARLEAYGTLDELNSVIGVLRALLAQPSSDGDTLKQQVEGRLQSVQNALFNMGSRLACASSEVLPSLPDLRAEDVGGLEADMDLWEAELPPLRNFILPGGSALAAQAHVARTVVRRVERLVLRLDGDVVLAPVHLVFLNRLSDWFFLLARKFNHAAGVADIEWTK